jgi:hypothetical protein
MNFIKIGSKVLTEVDRARLERISSCSKLKAEEYCETATKSMLKYCNLLLVSKRFRVFDMPLVKKIPHNWQRTTNLFKTQNTFSNEIQGR